MKQRTQKVLTQINSINPQNSEELLIISKVKSINFDLKSLEEEVKKIKVSLTKVQDLGDAYQKAQQLNTIFELF